MAANRLANLPSSDSAAEQSEPAGRLWLFACALITVAVWSYSTSFAGTLLGDDVKAIVENTSIRSLWPPGGPLSPQTDSGFAGRPIANLTFAINYALASGTRNLSGYHAFNLLVHVLAGLTLFGIVRRTLLAPPLRARFGDASAGLAFAVAVIWLVHPLNTQAVTFLSQRVESLMGLFYLTTLYCSIRAAASEFTDRRWTIAAIIACALGMGTKETMVTAPIVVAAWIWLLRPETRLFGRPRALLIGLGATLLVVIALAATHAPSGSAGFGRAGWPWWSYLRTQAGVIVHYVRLAFWPRPLVFQYTWLLAASWGDVLPQILLLVSAVVATGVALVRRWPIGLLGAWFFLILAPSSSILPIWTEVAAEHRMYLPLAAVVSLVILGGYAAWRAFAGMAAPASSHWPWRMAAWVAVAAITLPLALATHARNLVYGSLEQMSADVVASRPQDALSQLSYGSLLVGQGRYAEAEEHLRLALSLPLPPSDKEDVPRSLAHLYLGIALTSQRKFADGVWQLEQAIARPAVDREFQLFLDQAYELLADSQLSLGRPREAVMWLERAIAKRPDEPMLLRRAAWVLATSPDATARNGQRAIEYAERAVARTEGRDPVALDALAAACAEIGQFDRAVVNVHQALALVPAQDTSGLAMLRGHLALFEARRPVRTGER